MAENPRIEELRRRVQSDPASIAFAALAEEYRRARLFQESIDTCRAGLQRHPSYLSARVTLGRALLEVGEYDEARTQLEQVVRAAPENLAAIRALAEIHRRRGELPEAIEHYKSAISIASAEPAKEQAAPVEVVTDAERRQPVVTLASPEPPKVHATPVEVLRDAGERRKPGITVASSEPQATPVEVATASEPLQLVVTSPTPDAPEEQFNPFELIAVLGDRRRSAVSIANPNPSKEHAKPTVMAAAAAEAPTATAESFAAGVVRVEPDELALGALEAFLGAIRRARREANVSGGVVSGR